MNGVEKKLYGKQVERTTFLFLKWKPSKTMQDIRQ